MTTESIEPASCSPHMQWLTQPARPSSINLNLSYLAFHVVDPMQVCIVGETTLTIHQQHWLQLTLFLGSSERVDSGHIIDSTKKFRLPNYVLRNENTSNPAHSTQPPSPRSQANFSEPKPEASGTLWEGATKLVLKIVLTTSFIAIATLTQSGACSPDRRRGGISLIPLPS